MSKTIPVAPDLTLVPTPKLAILVSRFNTDVTHGLRDGALEWLEEHNIRDVDVFDAPGAFELPLMAQAWPRPGRMKVLSALVASSRVIPPISSLSALVPRSGSCRHS